MNIPTPAIIPSGGPRVSFVIGGVQKGGTTALAGILSRHPGLALPARKEAHFFDVDSRFASGTPPFDAYHGLWGARFGIATCGDATPAYCWWPPAAERIRDYNPAMRWVLLLRDPVSRAYSQWNMLRQRRQVAMSFEAALDTEIAQMNERPGMFVRMADGADHAFVSRGCYSQQLERLWRLFPREQFLIMRSEDLQGDPTPAVDRVCRFLGVAPMGQLAPFEAHVGRYTERLNPATRARLVASFEGEYARLEAMLGWDLSDWRR